MKRAILLALAFAVVGLAGGADERQRIDRADSVFKEIMEDPDAGIPHELLHRAHCVGIVPGLKKGGFIVGAKYGKGVMLCRGQNKTNWVGPSTVKIEGGSFGLQIGGGEVDVVLLVMNDEGVRKLLKSEFTLGAEAGAMAGPVGRSAEAETDAYMHAEILSYSKSRGLFAGVALDGSTLRADNDANEDLWGKSVDHADILNGKFGAHDAAAGLVATLNEFSYREK